MSNLKWLWKVSEPVCEHETGNLKQYSSKLRFLKRQLLFIVKAIPLIDTLNIFMHPRANSPLQRAIEQRPEIVGVVIWPYVCANWPARKCLHKIEEHYKIIEAISSTLDFPVKQTLLLLDLGDVSPNLKVVLDQPKWFLREGLLVINLFILDNRVYSLAFSFALESSRIVTYVGAIQGVDNEGILDDYKNLTKNLYGMRPRDFLVEVFRIFCRCAGVSKIFAVSNESRQHRSKYFGARKSMGFADYNNIWVERGGVRDSDDFFALSLETPMKNLDEVPAKKRAMYRRRYELLESVEERMHGIFKDQVVKNAIVAPEENRYH